MTSTGNSVADGIYDADHFREQPIENCVDCKMEIENETAHCRKCLKEISRHHTGALFNDVVDLFVNDLTKKTLGDGK